MSAFMRLDMARSADDGWYWYLVATNGRELCRSSETYTTRSKCSHAARLSLGLLPYSGAGVLLDADTYSYRAAEGRPPIRVRVLP